MLCVSAVNRAYTIIELSGSGLSWVTSTVTTKAKPQRVVIGHLSVKRVLFLVMLKRHSWRGQRCTSLFNPRIPPFFDSVGSQWIFLNYSLLCENSRANQAWRMSSPTRTFNSRDISFVAPFFFVSRNSDKLPGLAATAWLSAALHTACVQPGTFCEKPREGLLHGLIRFDRNS